MSVRDAVVRRVRVVGELYIVHLYDRDVRGSAGAVGDRLAVGVNSPRVAPGSPRLPKGGHTLNKGPFSTITRV